MNEVNPRQSGQDDSFPADGGIPTPARHEAHPTTDLVSAYRTFQDALQPLTDVIYNPCSGLNSSPSVAFPESRVIYAEWGPNGDKSAEANVEALQSAGLEAYNEDARRFDPGPVDVVILLNPAIGHEGPVASLKPGGYVLANDYHGTATSLHKEEAFHLQGIIYLPSLTSDESAVFDGENPESYWEKVETDEEFRASPSYSYIAKLSSEQTGTENPTLDQYLESIKRMRELHPDAIETDGYLFYKAGRTSSPRLFPCSLPSKKPVQSNDLFVFQRNA